MKSGVACAAAMLLWTAMPAAPHRLDEYLQATLISVFKDRVEAEVRLTPGVAVYPVVESAIDANWDGRLSESEQQAYAARVAGDLSFTIDGERLSPRVVSIQFPSTEELKEGRGAILLEFNAAAPPGGAERKLVFENHHQSRIAAYLVNPLVPGDPDIRLADQKRNESQSRFELTYTQAGVAAPGPLSLMWWSGARGWIGSGALLILMRFVLLWGQQRKARRLASR